MEIARMSPLPRRSVRLSSATALALALGLAAAPLTVAGAASHSDGAGRSALTAYPTEAAARTGCAGDAVVWRAHGSRVFHTAGSKYFGKTRHGAFVCERAAEARGLHAAKS
jgi:hypothetical protein